MSQALTIPADEKKPRAVPKPAVLSTIWWGWAASVPAALASTIAVEATPHTRGIGFFMELRFAIVTLVTIFAAIFAAFLYRELTQRVEAPRRALAGALGAASLLLLVALASFGPRGLVVAALPVVLAVALMLAWLVPRTMSTLAKPRRSRVRTAAIVFVGALELFGVAKALSTETASPPSAEGLAFDVPRAMFDVDHKFIDLPGGAHIHYVDEGPRDGETLLFLHGNPSWSFQWRDLIAKLRGTYRCIALDYPGFGLSNAAPGFGFTPREESVVVEEFVHQLALHDLTLVLQDWGGPIGLGFAGRHPELVRGVVLGSTWAWPTTTAEPRGKFSAVMGGPVGEFLQVNFNSFAMFGIKNGIAHEASPELLDVYARPFRPLERRGIAAFYPGEINRATDYFVEVESGLARLQDKPALIFWALKDVGFPRSDLEHWEKIFPTHKTIELPNADHFFFEDAADEMTTEIRSYTRRL